MVCIAMLHFRNKKAIIINDNDFHLHILSVWTELFYLERMLIFDIFKDIIKFLGVFHQVKNGQNQAAPQKYHRDNHHYDC